MLIIKKMETEAEIRGRAFVHYQSWQEAYSGLLDQEYLNALTLEKCERIAFQWPENNLIAKDGEKVVGFIAYGTYRGEDLPDTGEIISIYVLKDYYGKGIGRMLMEEGLKYLSYPKIALWVLKDNTRAIRFYEKNGFFRDGMEKEIWLGRPASEIRMVLNR